MGVITATLAATSERRIQELSELDVRVRGPLPLSTRVGFVGVAGGVGTSVAAGLATSTLIARRGTRILAVNASTTGRSVLWHTGMTGDATPAPESAHTRAGARRAAQAAEGLARTPGGGYAADLYDPTNTTPPENRWWEIAAPVARFFDFVVTDWGVRNAAGLGDVVSSSSLVCVTTAADLPSVQHGLDLAHTAETAGARAVLAVVDAQRTGPPALREILHALPVPAVVVPHDAAHGAARPVPGRRLKAATHLGALRLATTLVECAGQGRRTRA